MKLTSISCAFSAIYNSVKRRAMRITRLRKPTVKFVNEYLIKNSAEQYFGAEPALQMVFDTFHSNKDFSNVLIKVTCLNDLYNTNVYASYAMAIHIHSLNIDKRLKKGDRTLVSDVAYLKHANRNFFHLLQNTVVGISPKNM